MVVFILESSLQLNTSQTKAFNAIKRSRAAAYVVIDAFKLNLIKNKYGRSSLGYKQQMAELEKSLGNFSLTVKTLMHIQSREEAGIQHTKHQFKKLNSRLSRLEMKLDACLGLK